MDMREWLPSRRIARVYRWLAIITAGTLVVFVLGLGQSGIGFYALTVHITSASGRPIKWARAHPVIDVAKARAIATNPHAIIEEEQPFDGKSLTVTVPFSSGTCCFGFWVTEEQPRYLAILVEYADGRRAGQWAEIPRRREGEEVTTAVP
jgi:hypothetical protein